MTDQSNRYHHGALRAALISAAVDEVVAVGAAGVSLREIARRAGVSHAAPMHHFGDKSGLFTAIAAEGFALSADAIASHTQGRYGFLDGGAAYVMWAMSHPGHFEGMFRPGLYRVDDPDVVEASNRAFSVLNGSAAALAKEWGFSDVEGVVLAGWSLAHGLATLMISGNLEGRYATDPTEISERLQHGLIALGRIAEKRHSES